MIATVIDTAVLKAALLRLASEEPDFLQTLLLTLPQQNGKGLNGVSKSPLRTLPQPNGDLEDVFASREEVNNAYKALQPDLNGVSEPQVKYGIPEAEIKSLIQHTFNRYDETLRKLA